VKVLAAVARAPHQPFSLEELELDAPREDEILVRVSSVGICHTDLIARDQILPVGLPAVLGHEGAGVVERVGSAVGKVQARDRVILTFRSCGRCPRCADSLPAYCQSAPRLNFTGLRPDGSKSLRTPAGEPVSGNFFGQSSFATYALAYESNVVKAPDDTPLDLCGPLGCGIQTGAGAVMRSLACPAGSSLLVAGGGSVGLAAVIAAAARGCATIVLSEPRPERRALALELGATHVIDPAGQPLRETVRGILPRGADFALDCTGVPEVLDALVDCLGSHGTLGLVGVPPSAEAGLPGRLTQAITLGLTLKGIIEGDSDPDVFIPELLALRREGRFPFERLIATFPFEQINEAVAAQHDGRCIKAVLLMPGGG
jgi:aryl-alcohol dehydrogenase